MSILYLVKSISPTASGSFPGLMSERIMTSLKVKRQILLAITTLIILTILFMSMDYQKTREILRQAKISYFGIAILLSLLFPLLSAIRWDLIVQRLGKRLGLWESFKIIMAAWPLGTVTPAKSGDLVKVLFLKDILPYSLTTGVILAERIMDILVLALYLILGGVLFKFTASILAGFAIFAGFLLAVLVIRSPLIRLIPQKIQPLFTNLLQASIRIYSDPRTLVLVLLITAMNWFLSILQTWLCYKALNIDIPFVYMAAALPLAIFIGLIPVTISGMGIRDLAMIRLFEPYAPFEANLAVGILYSILGYWFLTLLGLPFMKAAFEGAIGGVEGKLLREKTFPDSSTSEHMGKKLSN